MEARSHLAPCDVGHPDCPRLFLDPPGPDLLCAQKTRPSFQLDVCLFWHLYRCVRRDSRHGCVDSLGSFLLACGRRQGDYGHCLRANGVIPRESYAEIAEPP